MNKTREQLSQAWTKVADQLSLKQYQKTMGNSNYKAKALFVMSHVSKSKRVHADCVALINLYNQLIK